MPNYLSYYSRLCETRTLLDRSKGGACYYEEHHILPRSLGGNDSKDNLVLLTPREHYIAHLLLYHYYKTIGGIQFRKMSFALVSMSSQNVNFQRTTLSSRQYEFIREAARNARLGYKVTDTTNYRRPKSKTHIEAIRDARLNSRPRSLKTRVKQSQAALLRGNNFTGNITTSICPHCNKVGQTNAMKRWHFDKCKEVNHA